MPSAIGLMRYLGHALVLVLAVIVSLSGGFTHLPGDANPFSLDRAVDAPSAFAHRDEYGAADTLVKPPSPVTQLVNRPRRGVSTHRVEEGDTLGGIAERYQISIPTLLWANGIAEDDVLPVGKQFVILPVSGILHTVQLGEKVEDLARRYQSSVDAIIEFNQITDPDHLVPNEVLVVPGGRREERPRPVPSIRGDARPLADDSFVVASSAVAPAEGQTQAEPASQQMKMSTYVVNEGDSLNGIAGKFGVSADTLAFANGLQDNPELIRPGQTLTILPVSGALYPVASGDSLLAIAERYGVDAKEIAEANDLSSVDTLSVGQKLIVPGARLAIPEARKPAAPAAVITKYTVAPGESLSAIAAKFGVEAQSIVRASDLASADLIVAGQQLSIPDARPQAAPAVAAKPAAAPKPKPVESSPPPPPPAPAAASADGNRVVEIASRYLGFRYTWGGHSPAGGFDCSGYTWYVYQQAGIRIPLHDLWGQLQAGPRIARANLQPGDLVFFENTYTTGLSHNGIYIGGGRFINAQDYGSGVRVASLNEPYWNSRYFGASRPW